MSEGMREEEIKLFRYQGRIIAVSGGPRGTPILGFGSDIEEALRDLFTTKFPDYNVEFGPLFGATLPDPQELPEFEGPAHD